jgi:uncharacterized protein YggT (Ycf19 family)
MNAYAPIQTRNTRSLLRLLLAILSLAVFILSVNLASSVVQQIEFHPHQATLDQAEAPVIAPVRAPAPPKVGTKPSPVNTPAPVQVEPVYKQGPVPVPTPPAGP